MKRKSHLKWLLVPVAMLFSGAPLVLRAQENPLHRQLPGRWRLISRGSSARFVKSVEHLSIPPIDDEVVNVTYTREGRRNSPSTVSGLFQIGGNDVILIVGYLPLSNQTVQISFTSAGDKMMMKSLVTHDEATYIRVTQ
jgi:hypothetical protein